MQNDKEQRQHEVHQAGAVVQPDNMVDNQDTQQSNQNIKKQLKTQKSSQLKRAFVIFAVLVFGSGSSLGYFLWYTPRAYAQEYIETVGSEISAIDKEMQYFLGGFDELSGSVDESREAFYEIAETTSYEEAKSDTAEDITAINKTLALIDDVRDTKNSYDDLPEDFAPLNDSLDTYLDNNEQALNTLLTHQEFKLTMLQAAGDELNDKLVELQQRVNVRPVDFPEDLAFYEELATLSMEAANRFEAIEDIPDTELQSYELKLIYHIFLAQTFTDLYEELSVTENPSEERVAELINSLSTFVQNQNEEVEESSRAYVEESDIVQHFIDADNAFDIVAAELSNLRDKYGSAKTLTIEN